MKKLNFKLKTKAQAKQYLELLKSDDSVKESSIAEKDGSFVVEYAVASDVSCSADKPLTMDSVYAAINQYNEWYVRDLHRRIDFLQDQLFATYNSLADHMNYGHIPPVKGAEKMEKVLEILGIDGDYEVEKIKIYSSATSIDDKSGDIVFELTSK